MGDGLTTGYVYDPGTDRWATTNQMAQGRVNHTASRLPDGRVLVAGGRNAQTNGTALNTTEIFDARPAAGRQDQPLRQPLGLGKRRMEIEDFEVHGNVYRHATTADSHPAG